MKEMEALHNIGLWGDKELGRITIRDIFDPIIKERTESSKFSYVERIARKEQRPSWCVCFFWNQPVTDMIEMLRQHSKDRDMKSDCSYWINVSYSIVKITYSVHNIVMTMLFRCLFFRHLQIILGI